MPIGLISTILGRFCVVILMTILLRLINLFLLVAKSHVLESLLDLTTGLRHYKDWLRWLLIWL